MTIRLNGPDSNHPWDALFGVLAVFALVVGLAVLLRVLFG